MKLLFLHGWGFDATLWDAVRAALPEFDTVTWDRGYFGAPASPEVTGPLVAIGHSLGALLLTQASPRGMVGLVAINGFDRFTGNEAVPSRVVDRMRRRFAEAPGEVLADFRSRCGAGPAPAEFDADRLATDLALLAEADARSVPRPPTLVLHGTEDPLLPPSMRATLFRSPAVSHGEAPPPLPNGNGSLHETFPGAGHLLPLTHPGWCADRIRGFAETLA